MATTTAARSGEVAGEPARSTDVTPKGSRWRRLPRTVREQVADTATTAVVSGLATATIFRLDRLDFRIPFVNWSDGLSQLALTKGLIETGWSTSNAAVGAPFGLQTYDYPQGNDSIHYLVMKAMSWFTSDPALITNLYYLASFVLVACTANLVMRRLGVHRLAAILFATIYTFIPYHFARGTENLFLAAYWSVPLGALIILRTLGPEPPFTKRESDGTLRLDVRSWRSLGYAVACIVLALANGYYGYFTVVLTLACVVIALVRRFERQRLLAALGVAGIVFASFAIVNLPAFLFRLEEGTNYGLTARTHEDVDRYALRPIELFTPVLEHRLTPLATLHDRVFDSPTNLTGLAQAVALGVVGSVGALLLLVVGLTAIAGRRERPLLEPVRPFAVAFIVALAFAMAGGLGWGPALLGLTELRVWSRLIVFLAFFALAGLGLALTPWLARVWRASLARRAIVVGVAALVLVGAVLDQTGTSNAVVHHNEIARPLWERDASFVADIESRVPAGSMIFQWPVMPYPEEGYPIEDYEPLRGYIHSRDLRWSYGGMRGRESDWQNGLIDLTGADLLDRIVVSGFDSLYFDRNADADDVVEPGLVLALGPPDAARSDERIAFWDLREWRRDLERRTTPAQRRQLRRQTLHYPSSWRTEGFSNGVVDKGRRGYELSPSATFTYVNRDSRAQEYRLRFSVRIPTPASRTLTIEVAGRTYHRKLGLEYRRITIPITLEPGETDVHFSYDDLHAGSGAGLITVPKLLEQ